MPIVDNVESFAKLNREFVAFRPRTHYENIIEVDSKKDVLADENARIEFVRYEAEFDNRVVEHDLPDSGCLFESIQ